MFSRKRGPRHVRSGETPPTAALAQSLADMDAEPAAPEHGPWDEKYAPEGVQRLDLGSLRIPAVEGVEVRVQANPEGGVEQVVLVNGDSALQLGVFAAPRTEGIWDEVRDEIKASMVRDGVQPDELTGPYGTELLARVNTPDGPADVRFVGVDGPRWMVRALYQGRAAANPGDEGLLAECLSGLVVVRDAEARPVRETLPLRLPPEMQAQAQAQQAAQQAAQQQAAAQQQHRPGTNGASAN